MQFHIIVSFSVEDWFCLPCTLFLTLFICFLQSNSNVSFFDFHIFFLTQSLSDWLSLHLFLRFNLTHSQCLFSYSHSIYLSHTGTQLLFLYWTQSLSQFLTHILSFSLLDTFSLSLYYTLIFSLSLTHILSVSLIYTHSPCLSPTKTHSL